MVLLEDTGALLGLVFALLGLMLGHITGNARWDAAGSMAIGVLLVVIAIILVIEMKSLLIGEAADVLYHLLVMLHARGITLAEVEELLETRAKKSGLEEKASRPRE